ncbi:DUF6127 family protein [Parasphingopyxis marina]|uniref:Uncharacterized protein n=1 Tax=Parasphingopyxis marina TaxID=2761622 RepID=A0A842I0W0_9SPHN|nr:DUF6127 family protein [Parasphingopyxis marina]MBC2778323.1 hypothetical protein [Parasphingopyxis marina]
MTDDTEMLTRLVAQLADRGGDLVTIRAVIEEASEIGAARAMHKLGLSDPRAAKDIGELRELLSAWRIARRGAIRSALGWLAKAVIALMLFGFAIRFGLMDGVGR